MKRLSILSGFILIVVLGGSLFYKEGSLPVNKLATGSKIFVISAGEGLTVIANKLASEGLIRNKIVFYLVVKQLGIDRKIQAGDFRLYPSMNVRQVAEALTHGTLDVWVTVVEGLRKEEVAQVIGQNLDLPVTEFIKFAKEGYLFPDTYLVPRTATVETVLDIFKINYDKKMIEAKKEALVKNNLSDAEIVTLASLVEKEAKNDPDRQVVASILLKRMKNDWPLQVDATIQYALGYQSAEKTWWKKNLSQDDIKINSFYNSYKNQGLPPTPISNPGLASIKAAFEADSNTPYWFYLSDKKGRMHYSKSIEEHNQNIATYLQ